MINKDRVFDAITVSYLFYKSLEMSIFSVMDLTETKNLPKMIRSSLVAPVSAQMLDQENFDEAFVESLEKHPDIVEIITEELEQIRQAYWQVYRQNLDFYHSLAAKGEDLEKLKKQIAESSKITSFAVYKDMLAIAGQRGKESMLVSMCLDANLRILSFAMSLSGAAKSLQATTLNALKKMALSKMLEFVPEEQHEFYLKSFDNIVNLMGLAAGTYETLDDLKKFQAKLMKEIYKKSLNLGYTAVKNFYQSFDAFSGTQANLQTIIAHPLDFLKLGYHTGLSSIEDIKKSFLETYGKHLAKRTEMLESIGKKGTAEFQYQAPYKSQVFVNTAAIASHGTREDSPWYSKLVAKADIYGKAVIKGLESAATEITKKAAKIVGASTAITINSL